MTIDRVTDGSSVPLGPDGVAVGSSRTLPIVRSRVAGDAYDRLRILVDGTIQQGDGTAAPSGGGARLPESTEQVIYVGKGAHASDSNDGLTPYSAKSTLAAALTALGGQPGRIVLGVGTWNVTAQFDLNIAGCTLEGQGPSATNIVATTTIAGAIIRVSAGRCTVRGLHVSAGGNSVTYGIHVTTTSAVAGSTENVLVDNVYADGGFVTNFATGADTARDVSETTWVHCASAGGTEGFSVGNSGTGNVLDTSFFGCNAQSPINYGIRFDGGGGRWYGGNFQASGYADVAVFHAPVDPILISGTRSENAARLLYTSGSGYGVPITLEGWVAVGFAQANNVDLQANYPVTIIGGTFYSGTNRFKINSNGAAAPGGNPQRVSLFGCNFDAEPVAAPASAGATLLTQIGCQLVNPSTGAVLAQAPNRLWTGNANPGLEVRGSTAGQIIKAVDDSTGNKLAVTGSRAGNAALASLLTQLATIGIITDSSTA